MSGLYFYKLAAVRGDELNLFHTEIPEWIHSNAPCDAIEALQSHPVFTRSPFVPGDPGYNRLDLIRNGMYLYLCPPEAEYQRSPSCDVFGIRVPSRDRLVIGSTVVEPRLHKTFSRSAFQTGGQGLLTETSDHKVLKSTVVDVRSVLILLTLQACSPLVVPAELVVVDDQPSRPFRPPLQRLLMEKVDGDDLCTLAREIAGSGADQKTKFLKDLLISGSAFLRDTAFLEIVHCDLNRQNIMCETADRSQFWFIDLGLAQLVGESHVGIGGSFETASLEQLYAMLPGDKRRGIANPGPISTESDVYSLAVIVAEFMIGHPFGLVKQADRLSNYYMFRGFQLDHFRTPETARDYLIAQNPRVQADYPELLDLVCRMLVNDPAGRPSPEEMLERLHRC